MKLKISTALGFIFLLSATLKAQTPAEKRSALASANSRQLQSGKGVQSIGQLGIIGKGTSHGKTIFQGFVQPSIYLKPVIDSYELVGISVFPNPFQSTIMIKSEQSISEEVQVRIVNLQGQEMIKETKYIDTGIQLNVRGLVPGNYFLQLVRGGRTAEFKLVKTRQ